MKGAVGIVTALAMERRWISDSHALVELSGVGASRAEAAARRLLEHGAVALVSWGVAGGLDPELAPGTIVLPDTVIRLDGSELQTDLAWRDRLAARIHERVRTSMLPLLHAEHAITRPEQKRAAHERTGAGAVDMESAAVASVAQGSGVPFIAVRAVLDTAGVRLPEETLGVVDDFGNVSPKALWRLGLRPGRWPGLVTLGRASGAAGRAMREVWSAGTPDLAWSEVMG